MQQRAWRRAGGEIQWMQLLLIDRPRLLYPGVSPPLSPPLPASSRPPVPCMHAQAPVPAAPRHPGAQGDERRGKSAEGMQTHATRLLVAQPRYPSFACLLGSDLTIPIYTAARCPPLPLHASCRCLPRAQVRTPILLPPSQVSLLTPPFAPLLQVRERKLVLQELAANPPQPLEWQDMHFA